MPKNMFDPNIDHYFIPPHSQPLNHISSASATPLIYKARAPTMAAPKRPKPAENFSAPLAWIGVGDGAAVVGALVVTLLGAATMEEAMELMAELREDALLLMEEAAEEAAEVASVVDGAASVVVVPAAVVVATAEVVVTTAVVDGVPAPAATASQRALTPLKISVVY